MSDTTSLPSCPIDALQAAAHFFTLESLEHCFELLRHSYPPLALIIQNHTAEYHRQAVNANQELWVSLELPVETVSDIVTALSAIAEEVAASPTANQEQRLAVHQTLLEWLMYAQSFLSD